MKALRNPLVLALALLAALPLAADLVKNKDWNKSPEYLYLATEDEKKAWKLVTTDEQADKFLALFWAKRNPELKNPANEFKAAFDSRVAKSDEVFALGKKRGALTERGKALIMIGPPKSVATKPDTESTQQFAGNSGGAIGNNTTTTVIVEFLYEEAQLPKWANLKQLSVKVRVDAGTQTESLFDVGTVRRLEAQAAEKAIVHPELKEPPIYKLRAEAEAEAKAAADAAAEAAKGPVLTPTVRKALEDALAAAQAQDGLSVLPLDYANGATRLMVQLFVPAAKGTAPDLKLAILVRGKDGKDAARKEEAASLQKTKGDFFADRVLNLLAGEYDLAIGLFDAAGAPVLMARGSTKVIDFPAEFSSSPLFVAYNDYEAPSAKPDDPFVFFQRKFVGKGGLKLDGKTDELAWVVRLYNPTVDAQRKITVRKTIKILRPNGQTIDVPQGPIEPITVPETKVTDQKGVVLDLAGSIVDSGLEQYFDPEGTIKITVTDMGAADPKPKVEVTGKFSIDMPERKAATPKKK